MNPPLITVAMPVFNASGYLNLAIESILNQTYTNWEMIAIDDGSTDNSLAILLDYQHKDSRIKVISRENKGIAYTLNQCIDMAKGDYIARMDADDISLPTRLESQLSSFRADPALDLIATNAFLIDEQNKSVGELRCSTDHNSICKRPWVGFLMPHPTWLGKTEWFRKYRYTIPAPYLCEDQDLLLRSHQSSKFAVFPQFLFEYRLRAQFSFVKKIKTRFSLVKHQIKFFLEKKSYFNLALSLLSFIYFCTKDLVTKIKIALNLN
jgi:glycosyltransferase involved in cell wall biosynthesis